MSLRTGHGNGAGVPRIETLPADELPRGVPAPVDLPGERDERGRFLPGSSAAQRNGALAAAKAKQSKLRALELLGLHAAPPELHPYLDAAEEWAEFEIGRLAQTVGGGVCGAGPSALVQSAALAMAASRYMYAQGAEHFVAGSRLANDQKQLMLAAHELVAREAKLRPKGGNTTLAAIEAAGEGLQ